MSDTHQKILDQFTAACNADERIVAAFVGGSHARDKADKFSDLDLYFITTDEAYEAFLAERESFVRKLGEPLFLEDFGVKHGYMTIYSNGAECEIWFGRESRFTDIHEGPFKVLLDKTGILEGQIFPKHAADRGEQIEVLRRQIDLFWHELSHFIKAMGRRQLWFAHGQLEVMRQICVALARMRYDFADDYAGKEPFFKIEDAMPVEQLSPLETTYCAMEYASILKAARVVCRFYQDVAPGLAREYNLPYQIGLERILMGQFNELKESA